ncbi:OpgC family protein [Rubritepida flocculans]|uniref:OpgC family protein n=1 Tax=Rubritepida flocculans TaxID=182403 RepID=UPI0003FEAFB5|nr:OpgC domain-containing protein [Rubritepida flocculans]
MSSSATPSRPARDTRADICRGLALWMIVINHTPGNWLGDWTLRNFSFSDATEAFVLLAGYAAAFAYAGQADRQGFLPAAAALVRRVAKLYVAHIFLLVVFTAQVGYSAAALDRAAFLDELALDPFAEDPYRALLEALLLRFQPHFLDILPLYIVLLSLFIPALLLRNHPWWLMGLSVGLWLGARATGLTPLTWQGEGWFFNPLAWQVLFFCGFQMGQAVRGAPSVGLPPRRLWLTAAAGLVLGLGLLGMLASLHLPALGERLPEWLAELIAGVDKASLHPWRLLSILAMAYLIGHYVPREGRLVSGWWARPFRDMGRHSLPVFCFGILLSFLARVMLELDDRWAMQVVVNLFCLAALIAVAWIGEWNKGFERPAALPAPAEPRLPRALPHA